VETARPGVRAVARRSRDETGFTLVELMIVILIIAILIAIGLPTYLGARERAEDRAAEANLRSSLASAASWWAQIGSYSGFDATTARTDEPDISWIDTSAPARGEVSIVTASGPNLLLVSQSGSGSFFCVAQIANNPATDRGRGTAFTDIDTIAECTGGWG
jgi:prepilin-type N-terminal cleavage/methylation domain-containing protein